MRLQAFWRKQTVTARRLFIHLAVFAILTALFGLALGSSSTFALVVVAACWLVVGGRTLAYFRPYLDEQIEGDRRKGLLPRRPTRKVGKHSGKHPRPGAKNAG